MTMIELSDEQAAALQTKAALDGLTLEDWLIRLAERERPRRSSCKRWRISYLLDCERCRLKSRLHNPRMCESA